VFRVDGLGMGRTWRAVEEDALRGLDAQLRKHLVGFRVEGLSVGFGFWV